MPGSLLCTKSCESTLARLVGPVTKHTWNRDSRTRGDIAGITGQSEDLAWDTEVISRQAKMQRLRTRTPEGQHQMSPCLHYLALAMNYESLAAT